VGHRDPYLVPFVAYICSHISSGKVRDLRAHAYVGIVVLDDLPVVLNPVYLEFAVFLKLLKHMESVISD